jgi:DMSO/TMAO reductase YedYZ molybdopterin-dependent catalytic subunit
VGVRKIKDKSTSTVLPPGQRARPDFPRFGLPPYAKRYQQKFAELELLVAGDCIERKFKLTAADLSRLNRLEVVSDFHCVTTWTSQNLAWSGYRFNEFFESLVKLYVTDASAIEWVVFKSLDGYRSRMLFEDIMQNDILLSDRLNNTPLCSAHGAPLRLVAPDFYGYKNPKHLKAIEFHTNQYQFKPPLLSFMEHPRGRVTLEERGRFFPGWLLRYLYRPLINSTVKLFQQTMGVNSK